MVVADKTAELYQKTYWASYNIPYVSPSPGPGPCLPHAWLSSPGRFGVRLWGLGQHPGPPSLHPQQGDGGGPSQVLTPVWLPSWLCFSWPAPHHPTLSAFPGSCRLTLRPLHVLTTVPAPTSRTTKPRPRESACLAQGSTAGQR